MPGTFAVSQSFASKPAEETVFPDRPSASPWPIRQSPPTFSTSRSANGVAAIAEPMHSANPIKTVRFNLEFSSFLNQQG